MPWRRSRVIPDPTQSRVEFLGSFGAITPRLVPRVRAVRFDAGRRGAISDALLPFDQLALFQDFTRDVRRTSEMRRAVGDEPAEFAGLHRGESLPFVKRFCHSRFSIGESLCGAMNNTRMRLLSIREFLAEHPQITDNQIRWALRNRYSNGFDECVYRKAHGRRKCLLDVRRTVAYFTATVPA